MDHYSSEGPSVSPEGDQPMSAADLRAQAEADGRDAIQSQMQREEIMFGQALLNQQAINRYHQAKATTWNMVGLVLLVIALTIPAAVFGLVFR